MRGRSLVQLGKLSMWQVPCKLLQGIEAGQDISLCMAPVVDRTGGMGATRR